MTSTDEYTKQKAYDEDSDAEEKFEDMLIKKEAKDSIQDDTWTSVQIEDIKVYRGYEFVKDQKYMNSKADIEGFGTLSEKDKDISELFSEIKNNNRPYYKTDISGRPEIDGYVDHNNSSYFYNKSFWVVITVKDHNKQYSKEYVVKRPYNSDLNSVNQIYKEFAQMIGENVTIGSPPDSNNTYIRTDKEINATRKDMLIESTKRIGFNVISLIGGFFASVILMSSTGSIIIGALFLIMIILGTKYVQDQMYDQWFEVRPTEWLRDIKRSGDITKQISESIDCKKFEYPESLDPVFKIEKANVNINTDGSIIVESNDCKWVFESEEPGIPSDKAVNFYKSNQELDINNVDQIPIRISKNDIRRPVKEDEYISEDGKYIMKF